MVFRPGIDVGGTNTDAVQLDGRWLLGAVKRPTSDDVIERIVAALCSAQDAAGISPAAIGRVRIGTTYFTNAVGQRRGSLPYAPGKNIPVGASRI